MREGVAARVVPATSIAWRGADHRTSQMLADIQANILRAHVRDHLRLLFFRVHDAAAGRSFVRSVAPMVKSALTHLHEVDRYLDGKGVPGTVYVGVGISASGYAALGCAASAPPDPAFQAGMRRRGGDLADPPSSTWDPLYRADLHVVVLIGDAAAVSVDRAWRHVLADVPPGVTFVGEEIGNGLTHEGRAIEHFGYVDGRSQPLFLEEEIAKERHEKWDPGVGLDRALVPDPGCAATDQFVACGSYLVYRKLEQNVRGFKTAEKELANALGLADGDEERAGAMIVGRFEDGTQVTSYAVETPEPPKKDPPEPPDGPPENDFTYDGDDGSRCPFSAHTRRVNPRTEETRPLLMARRGQTYGERTQESLAADAPSEALPERDVGLLFMAVNADIAGQFEAVQMAANEVRTGTFEGVDVVIAQPAATAPQEYPTEHGKAGIGRGSEPFPACVTLKGGEYFFLPSLPTLRSF